MGDVVAVTCYTGGEELCSMTERMLRSLTVPAFAVGQGVDRQADTHARHIHAVTRHNAGFALGINRAIELARMHFPDAKHVLVLNNDLEFPDPHWIDELLAQADGKHVVTPVTDKTGYKVAEWPGPSAGTTMAEMVGAFCWLVPTLICEKLRRDYGFWLFDPDFHFAYGEDDYTAAIFRKKLIGPKPFRVVHSSFVRHLRSQTAGPMKIDRGKQIKLLEAKLARL